MKRRQAEEPQVAQVDIGNLLLNKRHQLGASVAQIADSLKLNTSVLEKLETNAFSDIGSAVYVKGYLGLYAKHLGLDAAYVLGLYNTQYPAENVAIRPSLDQSIGQKKSKRHSKTLSFLLAAATFASLIYAYTYIEPKLFPSESLIDSEQIAKEASSVETLDSQAISGVSSVIRTADSVQTLADDVLNDMPIPSTEQPLTEAELSLSPPVLDTETTTEPPSIDLTSLAATEQEAPAEPSSDDEVAQANEVNEAEIPAQPAAETIHLIITFKQDCWLKITDANDKILASNVYSKKRKIDVKGAAPFSAAIGRPNAVKSVSINGKTVRLADYKVGNVKYTFK